MLQCMSCHRLRVMLNPLRIYVIASMAPYAAVDYLTKCVYTSR
jgi:hypothetical protein